VETGIDIVAYACPGCGYFHLSKKANGSDVVVKADVGITTGALRKLSSGLEKIEYPERANVTPIVPGNKEARQKALALYLKERDTATGGELLKVLGIKSTSSLGPYMREQGWEVSSHGRGAYWRRAGASAPVVVIKTPREQSIARHPSAQDAGWRPASFTDIPESMTVKDLFFAYKAAGLEMQIRVRNTDHTNGSGA
jgi:hypothetical protein